MTRYGIIELGVINKNLETDFGDGVCFYLEEKNDKMKELEEARLKALAMFENDSWVKWVHEGKPAYTNAEKIGNIALSTLTLGKHCSVCLNLNGCCFPKSNMPEHPLHPGCHCKMEPIYGIVPKAECKLIKFTEYIFNPFNYKGKKALFEAWGYDIMDSEWLQAEFVRQANEKYANSDFDLGKLDLYGQSINIEITLLRKDGKGTVTFISGWMVYPDGVIMLTTPYAKGGI